MRYICPASYDDADSYWADVYREIDREEGERQAADDAHSSGEED